MNHRRELEKIEKNVTKLVTYLEVVLDDARIQDYEEALNDVYDELLDIEFALHNL